MDRMIVVPARATRRTLSALASSTSIGLSSRTSKCTLPKTMRSPPTRRAVPTRAPATNVPLLDPRSRTATPPWSAVTSACRREMVGSRTGRSLFSARPRIIGIPGRSSNWMFPSVLTSRYVMTQGNMPRPPPYA